jgi:hypothetical protein
MREDAPEGKKDEEDDALEQAKARARAAAGDQERGLVAPDQDPPAQPSERDASSAHAARGVKGDSAK